MGIFHFAVWGAVGHVTYQKGIPGIQEMSRFQSQFIYVFLCIDGRSCSLILFTSCQYISILQFPSRQRKLHVSAS